MRGEAMSARASAERLLMNYSRAFTSGDAFVYQNMHRDLAKALAALLDETAALSDPKEEQTNG